MIHGIHHLAISVPDMDRAVEFYCGVLGFELLWGSDYSGPSADIDRVIGLQNVAADARMLRAGNAYIELWRFINPAPEPKDPRYPASDHGVAHFCLQVDDVEAEHARLSAAGMTFAGPPVRLGGISAIYGRDPFGNIIELLEIRGQAMQGLPAG